MIGARARNGARAAGVLACAFLSVLLLACENRLGTQVSDVTVDTVQPRPDTVTVYRLVEGWPALTQQLQLGEVAGVDVDGHGHLFVFQRASRGWDVETTTPIAEATVLQLDAVSGVLVNSWGSGRFRLPHGLTVGSRDEVWLTDAALHQVFRFSHDGELLRVLGEAGVGRWDRTHFNRPTDVAVRADGAVFVSDGYENQRIVVFDSAGQYVNELGRRGSALGEFTLPHGLARRSGELFVADRENDRIVQIDAAGGFTRAWMPVENALVYAIAVDAAGALYAAVRNDGLGMGGVVRLDERREITHGMGAVPGGDGRFLVVHDIAVGLDGAVYIAETRTGGLRKYVPVRIARN